MVFSSIVFLFRFLPVFLLLYAAADIWAPRTEISSGSGKTARFYDRWKNVVLLAGSLFFYAWGEPVYVLLLLFSTLSDYFHGRWIGSCKSRKAAGVLLFSSIVINLFLLGFFKYGDFIVQSVNAFAGTDWKLKNLPLPIGISFYTFQTMSYTIDVYRGKAKPQKSFLNFAVFVTMFPQLIAGPIVTYTDVEKQLESRHADILKIQKGGARFCIGLAKKVFIANQMGLLWETLRAAGSAQLSILGAWLGIAAFALQIYFDFSGYSDMAIGLGMILGFSFPENFHYPYIASSVTDFWRRWHISLGRWFRNYVYIPLGGNRKGLGRQTLNILIVWVLTGIWHGAGWNFLFWGLWFALFLILEKAGFSKILQSLPKFAGWIYTAAVVLVGWVFFELEKTGDILNYLKAMTGQNGNGWYDSMSLFYLREYGFWLILAAIGSTPFFVFLVGKSAKSKTGLGIAVNRLLTLVIPTLLFLLSVAYIVDASYNPFLYFRF